MSENVFCTQNITSIWSHWRLMFRPEKNHLSRVCQSQALNRSSTLGIAVAYNLWGLQFESSHHQCNIKVAVNWRKKGCRHRSVDSSAPSILPPRVWVPSTPSTYAWIYILIVWCWKYKKRPGLAIFLKKLTKIGNGQLMSDFLPPSIIRWTEHFFVVQRKLINLCETIIRRSCQMKEVK